MHAYACIYTHAHTHAHHDDVQMLYTFQIVTQQQPAVDTSYYYSKYAQMAVRLSMTTALTGALLSWPLLICAIPAVVFSIMVIQVTAVCI